MSHRNADNQNEDRCTPDTRCMCLDFEDLSSTTNITKLLAKNAIPNAISNATENPTASLKENTQI